jgi:hypothetical protein
MILLFIASGSPATRARPRGGPAAAWRAPGCCHELGVLIGRQIHTLDFPLRHYLSTLDPGRGPCLLTVPCLRYRETHHRICRVRPILGVIPQVVDHYVPDLSGFGSCRNTLWSSAAFRSGWEEAFAKIAAHLNAPDSPDKADFYTSGRASNEAAFLYQLFVRRFGTNNFPDCSNICHEATSVGLPESIGIGKGTVLGELASRPGTGQLT